MSRMKRACQFKRARRQAVARTVLHRHLNRTIHLTKGCLKRYTTPKGVRRTTKLKLNHYLKEYTYDGNTTPSN